MWSKASKQACAESLAQIQSAVGDQLDRLRAGFLDTELYMCLGVFNVASWQPRGDEDADRARRLVLLGQARAMCEGYRRRYSRDEWERAADAALQNLEELKSGVPSRSAGTRVDNRRVWSTLLLGEGSSAANSVLP